MGRPLKSTVFSSEQGSLAVKFNNGTGVVTGYIVRQTGSTKFMVSDGTIYKQCTLAQTTEAAQALTGLICTIEVLTASGLKYIKKMTANLLTTTDGHTYAWQRDPSSPGNGEVILIEQDTVFGEIPGWVPPSARAYGHFGLGQYFAHGTTTTVDDFYDPHPTYNAYPLPVVVNGLLQSSSLIGGVLLGPVTDDIILGNASTTVFDFNVDTFLSNASAPLGQTFTYAGFAGQTSVFSLSVELIAEKTVKVRAAQTGYAYREVGMFRFSGSTLRVAVTYGATLALSVNGSAPQELSGPGVDLSTINTATFVFYTPTFKLDDMVVYPPKLGTDLQHLSAVESSPNVPSWLPTGMVALADFNSNVFYNGTALVPMSDIIELTAPSVLVNVPSEGLTNTTNPLVACGLQLKGALKDAILAGPPVTVVVESKTYQDSTILRSTPVDGSHNALTVNMSGDSSSGTSTVQFTNGGGVVTTTKPCVSGFAAFHRFAFTLNGGQILTSQNGASGSTGTYSAPEPLSADAVLEMVVNSAHNLNTLRSIAVYSGAKTQGELNTMTGLPTRGY